MKLNEIMLSESVVIDGKKVNMSSFTVSSPDRGTSFEVDETPKFEDGTELNDAQIEKLENDHQDALAEMGHGG